MDKRKIIKLIRKTAGKCAEYVYPSSIYCVACGRETEPDSLYSMCPQCLGELKWANEKICAKCGKILELWYPAALCAECSAKTRAFDYGITGFQYDELARNMIHEFKYHGKSYMFRIFSEILSDKIDILDYKCDIVIPVPMYTKKEKERGYNQAALLAMFTAQRINVSYNGDVLVRTRATAPMNKLGAKERRKNLDGAFEITEPGKAVIKDAHVMLVDDIYTTGTTTEHCSELLKKNGAAKVTVLSLAAGRNQRELPDMKKLLHNDSIS